MFGLALWRVRHYAKGCARQCGECSMQRPGLTLALPISHRLRRDLFWKRYRSHPGGCASLATTSPSTGEPVAADCRRAVLEMLGELLELLGA